MNDKPGGANDRLDRQNLGARHFAVGGYPGTELIMMNISIISMVKMLKVIYSVTYYLSIFRLAKSQRYKSTSSYGRQTEECSKHRSFTNVSTSTTQL